MGNPSKLTVAGRMVDGLLTLGAGAPDFPARLPGALRRRRLVASPPGRGPRASGQSRGSTRSHLARRGNPGSTLPGLFQVAIGFALSRPVGCRGRFCWRRPATGRRSSGSMSCRRPGLAGLDRRGRLERGCSWRAPGLIPRPESGRSDGLSAFFGILLPPGRGGLALGAGPMQVVWVNTHGLFVLGPWVLVLFSSSIAPSWAEAGRPGAALAAEPGGRAEACLANPYGRAGACSCQLELFPKLTAGGGGLQGVQSASS